MPARTPYFRTLRRLLGTRRRFLKLAGAAAILPSDWACAAESGPVAIVGGGIAGLTAAYRLQAKGVPVELFEGAERLGGRMFTKRDFNEDGMFVELGGELIDTGHTAIIELAKELGLEMQNVLQGDKGHDRFWFGGRARSEEELLAGLKPLIAQIARDAKKLYDKDENFTAHARTLDGTSMTAYLDSVPGIDPWIVEFILAAYEPEYGVAAPQMSCLNLVDFTDTDLADGFSVFGESDEAWRIRGGNESLPEALAAKLRDKITIRTGQRLVKIGQAKDTIQLKFQGTAAPREFAKVILALPFTQLRKVEGIYELPLSSAKKKAIQEMGYGQNIKVMKGFKSRVWRSAGANGAVFADLPTFQNIWETSRGQAGESGILTNLLGSNRTIDPNYLKDVDTVFPGTAEAHDGRNAVMNWPKMPFHEGSYSCPLVGQYTWIISAAAAPECGGKLIFAGEHTSVDSVGFMNGGVDSGNRAASEVFVANGKS